MYRDEQISNWGFKREKKMEMEIESIKRAITFRRGMREDGGMIGWSEGRE